MTAQDFDRTLIAMMDRKPFTYFTVELTDGQRFDVDHPRSMVIRDGVAVFIAYGCKIFWFDYKSVKQIGGASANTVDQTGEQQP